jgi:hypothetical protein
MKDKFENPEADFFVIPGNKAHIQDTELRPLGDKTFDVESFI